MTVEELAALGIDDALLAREFRTFYGFTPLMLKGDELPAAARRREVFDRVALKWFARSPPASPRPS